MLWGGTAPRGEARCGGLSLLEARRPQIDIWDLKEAHVATQRNSEVTVAVRLCLRRAPRAPQKCGPQQLNS